MDFLEKDLEDIIHGTDQAAIRKRGLYCYNYDKVYRQVFLQDYGKADLITLKIGPCDEVGFNREIHVTVYELKQSKIDANALMQAARYHTAVNEIVTHATDIHDLSKTRFKFSVVLVGKTVETAGNFCFLIDLFKEHLSVYTYTYGFDGIHFDQSIGWRKKNTDMSDIAYAFIEDFKKVISNYRHEASYQRITIEMIADEDSPF